MPADSNRIIDYRITDWIKKSDDTFKKAGKAARTNDNFINNYRAVTGDHPEQETTDFNIGGRNLSNKITFRNAKVGEKVGLQRISLLKSNGDKENIFLIVPERESVGYGELRSLKDAENLKNADEVLEKNKTPLAMPITNGMWKNVEKGYGRGGLDQSFKEEGAVLATPITAALDIVGGNTMMSNVYKNELSEYTGPDKAVGLGRSDQSEGQIFGMISSDGEIIEPQGAKYFLTNLKKNGYKGVAEIEQPEKVQEHTGPAYVPGDILLGLIGLQPNRGAVGYTFKTPGTNSKYQDFVKNLRNSRRK